MANEIRGKRPALMRPDGGVAELPLCEGAFRASILLASTLNHDEDENARTDELTQLIEVFLIPEVFKNGSRP